MEGVSQLTIFFVKRALSNAKAFLLIARLRQRRKGEMLFQITREEITEN
jgi:hypothetical protein